MAEANTAALTAPFRSCYVQSMCRSIKTLRPPFTEEVGPDDMRAAALQYVRKVVGMRTPAPHNAAAFETAVDAITEATEALLSDVVVRGRQASTARTPSTTP